MSNQNVNKRRFGVILAFVIMAVLSLGASGMVFAAGMPVNYADPGAISASSSTAPSSDSIADITNVSTASSDITVNPDGSVVLPDVGDASLGSWVNDKTLNVISTLKQIGKPLAVLAFIVGIFFMILGILTGNSLVNKAIGMMITAAIVWVLLENAEVIMSAASAWMQTT